MMDIRVQRFYFSAQFDVWWNTNFLLSQFQRAVQMDINLISARYEPIYSQGAISLASGLECGNSWFTSLWELFHPLNI